MVKLIVFLALAASMFLVACSDEDELAGVFGEDSAESTRADLELSVSGFGAAPAATATPAATAAPAVAFAPQAGDGRVLAANLKTAQRRVISTASVSIEVELVQSAVDEVRVIAESLGGFVEHLNNSGRPEQQRASMTVRVPQDQFDPALVRIEALGEVQDRNEGAEDVSEQFIDLEARLKTPCEKSRACCLCWEEPRR